MLISPFTAPKYEAAYNIARTHGNYRRNWVGNSILVDPMDDSSGWTPSNVTLSYDTIYYKCGASNFRSIKYTKGDAATWSTIKKSISVTDLSDAHFAMRVYVHEGAGNSSYTRISYLDLGLYDSLGNYVLYHLYKGTDNYGYPGWYDLECILSGEYDDASGTPADLTDIDEIRLSVGTAQAYYIPSVTVDRLEFYKPRNNVGFIMFRFDGCYERAWDAIAYMESKSFTGGSRKLRGCLCVNDYYIGTPEDLTLQQVKDLQDMGHDVGIYLGNLSGLSLAQKIAKAEKQQDWLTKNGLGRGIRFVAHGLASNFDNESRIILTNARFDSVFCGPGLYGALHPHTLWDTRYLYWAHFLSVGNAVSGTALDNTAAKKGLFVYGAHVETADELTRFKSDIDTIVTKINAGGLVPITAYELIVGMD